MRKAEIAEMFHPGADEDDMFDVLSIAFEELAIKEVGGEWLYGQPRSFELNKEVTVPFEDFDDPHASFTRDDPRVGLAPMQYAETYTFRFWGSKRQTPSSTTPIDSYEIGVEHSVPITPSEIPRNHWPKFFETFAEIDPGTFEDLSTLDEGDLEEEVEINLDSIDPETLVEACKQVSDDCFVKIEEHQLVFYALDTGMRLFERQHRLRYTISYYVGEEAASEEIVIADTCPEDDALLLVHGGVDDENEPECLPIMPRVPEAEQSADPFEVLETFGDYWATVDGLFGEYDIDGTPFHEHAVAVLGMMKRYRKPYKVLRDCSEPISE